MALPSFLRLAGKREIRPGGKHGWEWVMKLLAPVAGERVLLVSTHWKRGRLPEGLSESGATVVTLDALPLGVMDAGAFDAVIIEDELAYLDDVSRVAVMGEARRVLRDGGRVVLHELHWRQSPSGALLAAMPEVWGRTPSPMTMDGWWRVMEQAGLQPATWHIGALGWFRERQVVLDEGRERAVEFLARANGGDAVAQRLALSIAHAVEYARFYGWVALLART
jgi:SAM-dependent methyltransferase